MPSEWRIWDFFRQYRGKLLDVQKHNAFFCFSDVIVSMLISEIRKETQLKIKPLRADEVTLAWVEQELSTPSLFSILEEQWAALIYDAHLLRPEVKASLLKFAPDDSSPRLILIFNKADRYWNDIGKTPEHFSAHSLQTPKFFEYDSLLSFMAERENVSMDINGQTTFLELVEHDPLHFSRELKVLQSTYPNQLIGADQVRNVIAPGRLDTFALATKMSKKQFNSFFKDLINGPQDSEHLSVLFHFLIGHLVKLQDPSYIDKKPRPNRYDKEIKMLSVKWRDKDVREMLNFTYNALTNIKQDRSMLNKFRQAYLASLK
jgi:hypothetical protein